MRPIESQLLIKVKLLFVGLAERGALAPNAGKAGFATDSHRSTQMEPPWLRRRGRNLLTGDNVGNRVLIRDAGGGNSGDWQMAGGQRLGLGSETGESNASW